MLRVLVRSIIPVLALAPAVLSQADAEIADAIRELRDERLDARAMEVLIDAGEQAVGPLLTELKGALAGSAADPRAARCLRVLRAIGPRAAQATPALIDMLALVPQDSIHGAFRRGDIATTIGQLLWLDPELAPRYCETFYARFEPSDLVLIAPAYRGEWALCRLLMLDAPPALASADLVDRLAAIERIRWSADASAVPTLVAVLNEPADPQAISIVMEGWRSETSIPESIANDLVRDAASTAIACIHPDHPRARRGLALLLDVADDPRQRIRAAMALGRHGDAARDHCDALLQALHSADDRLVAEAVTALGMIGDRSDEVLRRLRDLVDDPRPAIAKRAEAALRTLGR